MKVSRLQLILGVIIALICSTAVAGCGPLPDFGSAIDQGQKGGQGGHSAGHQGGERDADMRGKKRRDQSDSDQGQKGASGPDWQGGQRDRGQKGGSVSGQGGGRGKQGGGGGKKGRG